MTRPQRSSHRAAVHGSNVIGAGASGTILIELATRFPEPYKSIVTLLAPALAAGSLWLVPVAQRSFERWSVDRAIRRYKLRIKSGLSETAAREIMDLIDRAEIARARDALTVPPEAGDATDSAGLAAKSKDGDRYEAEPAATDRPPGEVRGNGHTGPKISHDVKPVNPARKTGKQRRAKAV